MKRFSADQWVILGFIASVLLLGIAFSSASFYLNSVVFSNHDTPPGYNVILISIDTLRADRLGCYGYDRATSPLIDSLARRGVRFARAIAESSWTLPSHMSIFTGLVPSLHGVTLPTHILRRNVLTLTQLLKLKGYRTYANTDGGFVHGAFGFQRGFEQYVNTPKSFDETIRQAQQWIEQLAPNERYFMFLHTYEVHCPYHPPRKYSQMFQTRPAEDHIETRGKCGNPDYNSMTLTPGQVAFLSNEYDASICFTDDCLRDFVNFLDRRQAFQKTILVFLSDHGEEFYEHGQIGHERTLYIESLRIPLIIVAPNVKPRVVEELVGLANVMPTILEMLAIPAPSEQGRSLVPLLMGTPPVWDPNFVISELDRDVVLRSVTDETRHFIENLETEQQELYDIKLDPLEHANLLQTKPEEAETFASLLRNYSVTRPGTAVSEEIELDAEQYQRLRSLGYLH